MNLLIEIFESNSDKARFITIVFSTFVAVGVVLLNQFFTARKSRKDLLVEKVELLYQLALDYEKKAMEISDSVSYVWQALDREEQDEVVKISSNFDDLVTELHELIDKLTMLFDLYFHVEKFDRADYVVGSVVPGMVALRASNPEWREFHKGAELVAEKADVLKLKCRRLMKRYSH